MYRVLAPIMLLVLSACSSYSGAVESGETSALKMSLIERANSIPSKSMCDAEGGSWQKVGRLQLDACVLPSSDAGSSCTDSTQCEVACVSMNNNVKPGDQVYGVCSESTNLFGCHTYVSDGTAEHTLCVD